MGLPMIFTVMGLAFVIWIIIGIIKKNQKNISLWPQSRAGKWSVGLVILSLIMMIMTMIVITSDFSKAAIFGQSWLVLSAIATIVCIKALWKDKERSIIFLLCSFIMLIMFIMAGIEIIEGIRMLLGLPVG